MPASTWRDAASLDDHGADGHYTPALRVGRPGAVASWRATPVAVFRVEWRRLTTNFQGTFCDLRFETAVEASAARALALAVGMDALGGEFLISAPDGGRVFTTIDAVRAWDVSDRPLPSAAGASLWRAEHDLVSEADTVMTGVRAALMDGVEKRVLSMRHALLLLAALRSVMRRTVV